MTIGEKLTKIRKDAGLSQEAFGESLGVSRQAISKWESDSSIPDVEKLIAINKTYGADIGWILGTKDNSEDDSELTPRQLDMVNEIAAKYIAALDQRRLEDAPDTDSGSNDAKPAPPDDVFMECPPSAADNRRRKNLGALKFIAAGAAVIWAVFITFRVMNFSSEQDILRSSIQNMRTDVYTDINSIASRVEEVLKAQNTLFALYDANVQSADLSKNIIYIKASVVPKTYVPGTQVYFIGDTGEERVKELAEEGEDHLFSAVLPCPLRDYAAVYAEIHSDGKVETQLVSELGGFSYDSAPDVICYATGFWAMSAEDINSGSSGYFLDIDPVNIRHDFYGNTVTAEKADLFVIKNGKKVFHKSADINFENGRFQLEYNPSLTVKPGDELITVVIITDNYGRRHVGYTEACRCEDEGHSTMEAIDLNYLESEIMEILYGS